MNLIKNLIKILKEIDYLFSFLIKDQSFHINHFFIL